MLNGFSRFLRQISLLPLFAIAVFLCDVGTAAGAGSWFSRARDVTSDSELLLRSRALQALDPVGTTVIDLTISLHGEPSGDGVPSNGSSDPNDEDFEQQQVYEKIIDHWTDAVCEQTNGALRLGTIRIFTESRFSAYADVVWFSGDEDSRATANAKGFRYWDGHIKMYDKNIFDDDQVENIDENMREAGYTLAHEFGHYVLGLYDEYNDPQSPYNSVFDCQTILGRGVCYQALNSDNTITPSIMSTHYEATPGNGPDYTWLNHSVAARYDNSTETAQRRVYSVNAGDIVSAWDVLAQAPSEDPQGFALNAEYPRQQYSELADVVPNITDTFPPGDGDGSVNYMDVQSDPTIEYDPTDPNTAECPGSRNHTEVIWMSDNYVMQIVLDRSGSMVGQKITDARNASLRLVNNLQPGDKVGVVAFNNDPEQLEFSVDTGDVEFVTIGEDCNDSNQISWTCGDGNNSGCASKVALRSKDTDNDGIPDSGICTIEASGATSLYEAARTAIVNLRNVPGINKTNALVFLLSDGENVPDVDDQAEIANVVALYNDLSNGEANPVPLNTFAYGEEAPINYLVKLSDGTEGLFSAVGSPTEVNSAFLAAQAALTSSSAVLREIRLVPAQSETQLQFAVDQTLETLVIRVDISGIVPVNTDDEEEFRLSVVNRNDPDSDVGDFTCSQAAGNTTCSMDLRLVSDEPPNDTNPNIGNWVLQAHNGTGAEHEVRVDVLANTLPVRPYELIVTSLRGTDVTYPDPILLTAKVLQDWPITGVGITATIKDESGEPRFLALVDDGENGDGVAGDGTYSAIVDYQTEGIHTFEVKADNTLGDAFFTAAGYAHPPSGGTLPTIKENFTRTARLDVVVSFDVDGDGVADEDDHPDSPPGTSVDPDNRHVPGRIGVTEDVDVFSVPVIGLDHVDLRLTDLAFGMEPQLRVERKDQSGDSEEIVAPTTIEQMAKGATYLSVSVPVTETTEYLYAFVTHATGGTGYYEISAGPRIVSDPPVPLGIDIKPDSEQNFVIPYLPGHIAVALLGSETYDIRQIDPETLAFGPGRAPATDLSSGVFKDVNGDGLEDYVNTYSVRASGIRIGDTQACLSGMVGGIPFTGCDKILTMHILLLLVLVLILLALLLFVYLSRLRKRKNAQTENNAPEA